MDYVAQTCLGLLPEWSPERYLLRERDWVRHAGSKQRVIGGRMDLEFSVAFISQPLGFTLGTVRKKTSGPKWSHLC